MVKRKQAELTGYERLFKQMTENSKTDYYSAGSIADSFRYIDFVNPRTSNPVISLEWLFGSRGLLAGRIMKLQAMYGCGKSSLMFFLYACGQIKHKAWCMHIETEGAVSPADFIASYGCNPDELLISQPKSVEESLNSIEEFIANIRGGLGGEISDAGRRVKSKYTDPIDEAMDHPIIVGYDSISGLGEASRTDLDVVDLEKAQAISKLARVVSGWFRDRNQRLKDTQTLLLMSAQERANVQMGGPGAGRGGPETTTIADKPIGFYSTWIVKMQNYRYTDKEGNDIGERINLYTEKNKLSDKHRGLVLYLVRNQGFDLEKMDIEFLTSNPAVSDAAARIGMDKFEVRRHSHGITCEALSDQSFKADSDFLNAFYAKEDLVMSLREQMRIRGFNFGFETAYRNTDKPEAAEEAEGAEPSEE